MSKRNRRVLLFGVFIALLAVLLGVGGWMLWPRTAITQENATKIKIGMTLAEVHAVLGGPARDETTGPVEREEPPEFASPDARGIRWRITIADMRSDLQRWESDQARVWVHFEENSRVTDCQHFQIVAIRCWTSRRMPATIAQGTSSRGSRP